jgi:membrane protein
MLAQAARLRHRVYGNHLPLLAAGLSFYGLMAMCPVLVMFLSLYGLIGDPRAIERDLAGAQGFLPDEVIRLLAREMHKLVAHPVHHLSASLALGFALTLVGASTAASALMHALNVVFGLEETRGFLKRQAIALGLTAGLATFVAVLLGFLALTPTMLRHFGLGGPVAALLVLARWPVAALLVGGALAAIYRLGPNHARGAGWMVGWGTPAATAAWLVATALFSLYVARFDAFDKTYGSIGAAIVLLVWLYLTALVVLVGGEIHLMTRAVDRAE